MMLQIEVTDLASEGNCTAAYHAWGAAAVTGLRQGAKKQLQQPQKEFQTALETVDNPRHGPSPWD